MSRTVTIFCDGGLGNRLGALVGGLVVAEKLSADPIICWPVNNWCGCKFTDLFDVSFVSTEQNIFELFESQLDSIFLIHENQTDFTLNTVFGHNSSSIDAIQHLEGNVVYYHNKIDPSFDRESILQATKKLTIKKTILKKVDNFVDQNNITASTIGLHLRKTDMVGLDEDRYYNKIINASRTQFFVCSDDKQTEKRFSELDNVCVFPKTSYAKKMVSGNWRTNTIDTDGRPTKYNVTRNRRSVVQAFVDLLVLSRCYIQPTVKSSFSLFARIYAEIPELPSKG